MMDAIIFECQIISIVNHKVWDKFFDCDEIDWRKAFNEF